MILAVLGQ
jgi:hypothetical protein